MRTRACLPTSPLLIARVKNYLNKVFYHKGGEPKWRD